MKQRDTKILDIVTTRKKVEVSVLAEELGVSKVTMRKDLDRLEERGLIKREHGYAVLQMITDIQSRLAYHYETKRRIAEKACEMIHDGDSVMIESGSCCALAAEAIARNRKDVTIITNSAFIATYVRDLSGVHVVLLGGNFQPDSQVCVGPLISQSAKNFFVNKMFVGTDGYTGPIGFTNADFLRAQAVRDMSAQAEQVVILTESEKFTTHGVVPLNISDKLAAIVTDDDVPDDIKEGLEAQGVTFHLVSAQD